MYPEVRAAIAADDGPDLTTPGFDVAAHREDVRLANLRLPREDVASVADVDADGVPLRPVRRAGSWAAVLAERASCVVAADDVGAARLARDDRV